MAKEEKLNSKTPLWFKEWHWEHFRPTRDRAKRNEKWIYIILVAIIGSGVWANGHGAEVVNLFKTIAKLFS